MARSEKVIVGGTKNFRFDVISKLQPDLIIGNKEENYLEGIEQLSGDFPVWVSDIRNLDEAFDMMECIGSMTSHYEQAAQLTHQIRQSFSDLKPLESARVVYLIWNEPLMVAGKDTFIDHLLRSAGFSNLIEQTRYPVITMDQLEKIRPDLLLLSSEPFPFRAKHMAAFQRQLPNCQTVLVDGEMFSWYGSRLVGFPSYIDELRSELKETKTRKKPPA